MSNSPLHDEIPFRQRLSCTVGEACDATGLGRSKIYLLMQEGVLASTTVGRRRLILVESLLALLRSQKPS
ncbi:MAG: helix-turn-helix domain-containing protein [Proteobacteria bacterium]|nr:helix-turn-helix domain-containing protein [Pseudomonadota bacterium]